MLVHRAQVYKAKMVRDPRALFAVAETIALSLWAWLAVPVLLVFWCLYLCPLF